MAFKEMENTVYWIGLVNGKLIQKTFKMYSDSSYLMIKDEEENSRAFGFRARENIGKILVTGDKYTMYSYEPIDPNEFLEKVVKMQVSYIHEQYSKANKMLEKMKNTKKIMRGLEK